MLLLHQGIQLLSSDQGADGDIEQAMQKLNSKLIADLSKRHSKLAKNVIESRQDKMERKWLSIKNKSFSNSDVKLHFLTLFKALCIKLVKISKLVLIFEDLF